MPLPAEEESNTNGHPTTSIKPVCAELAARINAFLKKEVDTQLLRDVQAQTRTALGVIEECLQRYRLVLFPFFWKLRYEERVAGQ